MNCLPHQPTRRDAGFSLVEIMVALVLGLLVAAGIVSVFQSTFSSSRAQTQLARLQEEGRFAIGRMRDDLLLANSQYCSNSGGNAARTSAGVYLDGLRAPTVYASDPNAIPDALSDVTTSWAAPATPFSLPSFLYMRGHDCTTAGCTPLDPHNMVASIPAMGKAVGMRVIGASVLTIRYLDPQGGWAVVPSDTARGTKVQSAGTTGAITEIDLDPLPGEPEIAHFGANDLAYLSDCSNGRIFAVQGQGGSVLTPTGANFTAPQAMQGTAAPRLYDFDQDFLTVTYYLKVVDAGDGRTTGALIRRVNGNSEEMVRGVERLDFRYGVINASGETVFLSADQIDKGVDAGGSSIPCPPDVPLPGGMPTAGCLWRAVNTIEVHMLLDGQTPLYTLTPNELAYAYTIDGAFAPRAPSTHAIKPSDQGFPDQLLRREFVTLVSLRNYNP